MLFLVPPLGMGALLGAGLSATSGWYGYDYLIFPDVVDIYTVGIEIGEEITFDGGGLPPF